MGKGPDTSHIDVRYVADLARLELSDDEIKRYEEQLGDVLHYVDQLGEVDVSGVDPTAHAMPLTNVMRDDRESPGIQRDDVLSNAPASLEGGLIRVPAVIDGEEGA
ncbi:MAG: Asp-tRNA(Asn)/Glu-tRNA(Gln) amidotransferase subunit GatC [Candidatus Pacebacteria bacterium]|nr:Asp-tRNA(Asn)/Glu-tRNA(Gln) amidotransferase subunit GatC [Candidatus Paceibacterota bacterium]